MVSERDRIIRIAEYLKSLGIILNIGKNKARGNRGIFLYNNNSNYRRIDISNNVQKNSILPTIIHEFCHYVHKKYNPKMDSLHFVFDNYDDEIENELINVTVKEIPQKTAKILFLEKNDTLSDIKELSNEIKSEYNSFNLSRPCKIIEKSISYPINYLIKYDRVRILNMVLSVQNIEEYSIPLLAKKYIVLKSKQRKLRRINSKISRLNRYYNQPSELLARFVELYFTDIESAKHIAPLSSSKFECSIKNKSIPEFSEFANFL